MDESGCTAKPVGITDTVMGSGTGTRMGGNLTESLFKDFSLVKMDTLY